MVPTDLLLSSPCVGDEWERRVDVSMKMRVDGRARERREAVRGREDVKGKQWKGGGNERAVGGKEARDARKDNVVRVRGVKRM